MSFYRRWHGRAPYSTEIVQSCITFALGDIVSQTLVPPRKIAHEQHDENEQEITSNYDLSRITRAAATGMILAIPTFGWIKTMGMWKVPRFNELIGLKNKKKQKQPGADGGTHTFEVLCKVAASQVIFSPFFQISFLSLNRLFLYLSEEAFSNIEDGDEPRKTLKETLEFKKLVTKQVPETWLRGLVFWPIVGAFNFTIIPFYTRGIYNATAGIFWQAYMSTYAARHAPHLHHHHPHNQSLLDLPQPVP